MLKIAAKRLLSFVFLFFACFIQAQELISDRAYFVDTSGQMTLEQVQRENFRPFNDILNLGYSKSVTWIRLTIDAPPEAYRVILRVRPNYLDDLQLFSSDDAKKDLHLVAGDRYLKKDSEYKGKDNGFWIRPIKPQSTYYLRVQTTSTSLIFPQAMLASDLKEVESTENLAFGFYLGLMVWILIWAITTYIDRSETLLAGFIAYQFLSILMAICFVGYIDKFVPSTLPTNRVTSNIILLVSIAAFFFHRNFIAQYEVIRIYRYLLNFIFVFVISNIFYANFVDMTYALEANAFMVLTMAFVLTGIVVHINRKNESRNYTVLFTYIALSFVMILSQAMGIGLIHVVELGINVALLHGLFAGVLIYLMMHDRFRRKEKERVEEQTQALIVAKKLENETSLREAQSAFIALLIHELKSPIAVVKLALSSIVRKLGSSVELIQSNLSRLESATDDMNMIIERCIEVQKVDTGTIPVHKKPVDVSKLLWTLVRTKDRAHQITLAIPDSAIVETDEELIKIVLLNLIENALKYAKSESNILIDLNQVDEQLTICVQNEVEPIAMPQEMQIFQKFYRAEESKRHRGSGLGLWLSREMAELIGAQLNYRSEGSHVVFELSIPTR